VSSTELSSIFHVMPQAMNRLLTGLRAEGYLEPSRASGTGRGFYYRPTRNEDESEPG
jgi:hypothetical protein